MEEEGRKGRKRAEKKKTFFLKTDLDFDLEIRVRIWTFVLADRLSF